MATQEQIMQILQLMEQAHPAAFTRRISETSAGIGAVLRLLAKAEGPVSAGKISDAMGVSTARVAVLLKKMASKDLIVKESNPRDARITMVRLSAAGTQTVAALQANLYAEVGAVIDQVGMERMLEFAAIAREIHSIMKGPPLEFCEGDDSL